MGSFWIWLIFVLLQQLVRTLQTSHTRSRWKIHFLYLGPVLRAKLKSWEIQTSICKEMCKKLLVLTKCCRSWTDRPALVSDTVKVISLFWFQKPKEAPARALKRPTVADAFNNDSVSVFYKDRDNTQTDHTYHFVPKKITILVLRWKLGTMGKCRRCHFHVSRSCRFLISIFIFSIGACEQILINYTEEMNNLYNILL